MCVRLAYYTLILEIFLCTCLRTTGRYTVIREVDGIEGERVNILVHSCIGEVDRIGDEGVKISVNSRLVDR